MPDRPDPGVREAAASSSLLARRRFLQGAAVLGVSLAIDACAPALPPTASPASPAPTRTAPSSSTPTPTPTPTVPPTPSASATRRAEVPVSIENRLRGASEWDDAHRSPGVAAYLGQPSTAPGGGLLLRASGARTVDVEWYRLGWYGGLGGRLLRTDRGVRLTLQAPSTLDPQTGLVEARWPTALATAAPADCPSGMLLAVLRGRDGSVTANVPIVLRPDASSTERAPVLFVSAAATWQAYNVWGGLSLYDNTRTTVPVPATAGKRSALVSFDRPYLGDAGAMYLRRWELQFIRWMEREGRDVEYAADVDLALYPALAEGRRMIVMAGHPEYWSRPMRETIEAAVADGTNVAFLTANEVYWSVRLEAGPTGPGMRMVCYKSADLDPVTTVSPGLATCRWREPPLNAPEARLVGQMYGLPVQRPGDWIVAAPKHWLYEGTLLRAGDHLRNLVGQEYDTFHPELAPAGTIVLASGPVDADRSSLHDPGAQLAPTVHNATIYTAGSGATVVSAGTFQWSWAIDHYGSRAYKDVATPYDARVARMTGNLFDRLGDGPLAP